MSAFKRRHEFALPDIDPAIALIQAARLDIERHFLLRGSVIDKLLGRAERTAAIAALFGRFRTLIKWILRRQGGRPELENLSRLSPRTEMPLPLVTTAGVAAAADPLVAGSGPPILSAAGAAPARPFSEAR